MSAILTVSLWSHAAAALLYAALTVWQLRHLRGARANRPLVAAFAVMSAWAGVAAASLPGEAMPALAESARNLAFLVFMYSMIRGPAGDRRGRAVKFVYAAVASVIGVQVAVALVGLRIGADDPLLTTAGASLGMIVAAGALILVHNLYGQAASGSRGALQLPVIALTALWAYDLHLYTFAWLSGDPFSLLAASRGIVAALLVPLFALASRRGGEWRVQLSRSATFQSLSLVAILVYLATMTVATEALEGIDGEWGRIAQPALIAAMAAIAAAALSFRRARAWMRVMIAKHFFAHRYDYRADWLRFTRAIGRAGGEAPALAERVVKALADMAGAPGGMLLVDAGDGRMTAAGAWNWRHHEMSGTLPPACARFLATRTYVIDFAALAGRVAYAGDAKAKLPAWLAVGDGRWAGVPLIHDGALIGLVVLDHPEPRRSLDWEDFDLFRTAGIQAASYLAEARGQDALAEAQRFDEFNRRFAFIMHDIKNLVSQLSLVARNAERHAGNPAFRADMIATLQGSVAKMNGLLARLSRGEAVPADPGPVRLQPLLAAIAGARRRTHPIEVDCDARLHACADAAGLSQALGHLVQNAVEASPPGAPVRVSVERRGDDIAVHVADSGHGMSAEFVRTRLFTAFASTKPAGFGIGAFEARQCVAAMGGRIDVTSREGEGSRFTVWLPRAEGPAGAAADKVPA